MTPVQVAIALNIREPEATQYYKEYWELRQLHSLNWVYEQVKDSILATIQTYTPSRSIDMLGFVTRNGVGELTRPSLRAKKEDLM
jgi:hypothetical protein